MAFRQLLLPLLFAQHAAAQNVTNFTPPEILDVGINLSPLTTDGLGVKEWMVTSTRVFRDLFKHATFWAVEQASFDGGVRTETWKHYNLEPVNMSYANGYPMQLPIKHKWNDVYQRHSTVAYVGRGGGHVAPGPYAVHFDGNGTLGFGGDATETAFAHDAVSMRGRYVINVSSPAQGVEVRILSTDPNAPLHRIRIVRLADEMRSGGAGSSVDVAATDASLAAQPFHEDLLSTLSGVRVLRFCGWARIDANDYEPNNFKKAWGDRATPDTLTQAGPRGVALEYMVALANRLNASAWFCMPRSNAMKDVAMSSPSKPGEADEADLQAYASHVHSQLAPHLSAIVEYRTLASNDNENPQTHAIESLEVWRAWTTAMGADAARPAQLGTRLVRVSAAGPWLAGTLNRFGSDIGSVDAVALHANFGALCPWGTKSRYNKCVDLDDREIAAEYYQNWTVDQLLDKVQESALYAEAALNAEVQTLNARGIRALSDVGGPAIGASSYGARATLNGARHCERCHREKLGNKYGIDEFAALSAAASSDGGYVVARQWKQALAYQGIGTAARAYVASDENGLATYWRHLGAHRDNISTCFSICDASDNCTGFVHHISGEWSCGVNYHSDCPGATSGFNGGGQCYERYGQCPVPGTCYFFNNETASRSSPREMEPREDGTIELRDVYWKGPGRPGAQPHLTDDAQAGALCRDQCGVHQFYRGEAKLFASTQPDKWTLDMLSGNRSYFERIAALEQSLEGKLLEVNAHPRMREIFLDFLDRWRRIGGSVFVAQPLYRPPVLCTTGGKSCGHGALMLGPDDLNSSKLQAVVGYNLGLRSTLPRNAAEARAKGIDVPPAACVPACVWGTCVRGVCKCYLGVEGDTCDRITGAGQPNACADRSSTLGINIAGVNDWSREWAFVDVFKGARAWCHMQYGDSNCRSDLAPKLELGASIGGFPTYLPPTHRACAMMVRDLETHFLSGVYTVLYEGDGTLEFSLDTDYVRRIRPGLIEVDVHLTTDQNNGIYLCLVRQNADDPLRQVRVMAPGYAASGALENAEPEFHPAFLHSLRKFKHLRFMNWARVNDEEASVREWGERAREGAAATKHSYAVGAGVPHESMVRLSNTLGAAPWITVPHNASDDYVEQLARLLNATLRPDLAVTISLSNEMWHGGYVGGQFAHLMGITTGLGRYCWYVGRTVDIAQIMRPIVSNGGRRNSTFVVESQAGAAAVTGYVLDCLANTTHIDAIGIAPYFDGYDPLINDLASLEGAYEAALNRTLDSVRTHAAMIASSRYSLVTYEAGPDGKGNGTAQDFAIAAHRAPWMKRLTRQYYEGLRAIGVTMNMHFTSAAKPSKYGNFGAIEAADQDPLTAPKQQALFEFLDAHATCDQAATTSDSTCAAAGVCSGRGHCLAPRLRGWGVRDSDECSCYFANSGVNCSVFTPVVYRSCGYKCTFDQGTCAVSGIYGPNEYWSCTACHPSHFGATCSRFRCKNDCNGHGHCLDADVCSCLRGFAGDACEHDCGCSGHGQCKSDGTCVCDVGWRRKKDGTRGCEWDCDTVDIQGVGCIGPGLKGCASCTYGACVDGICRCWAGYKGASCTEPAERANAHSTYGLNLAAPGGANWVFVDLMRESREWTSINDADRFAGQFSYQGGSNSLVFTNRQYTWGNGVPKNLTAQDYPRELKPGQALITLMARDVCKHTIEGRYVLLYEGDGEIDVGMDAKAVAFQTGRIDFDFTPTCRRECWFDRAEWVPYCSDNGVALTIRRVNPKDPLRNIKLIAPGHLATHHILPFQPWFLRQLTRYSTLRFMDWSHTNQIPRSVIRPITNVAAIRLNATKLRGPTPVCALVGDFFLFFAESPVPITAATDALTGRSMPQMIDGSEWTDDCAAGVGGEASVVFSLASPSAIDAYAWRTGHQNNPQNDPVRWVVEGLVGSTWSVLDRQDTFDHMVTLNRRTPALMDMLTSSNLQFSSQTREVASSFAFQATANPLEWADRVMPSHRNSKEGVALEHQIALANQVGANPWLCVHHLATDGYVRKMAELVRDTLRPDVLIYVEHSNEVWNPMFPQGQYARRKGLELGLHSTGGTANDCSGFGSEDVCASIRFHAKRSLEIFAIWTEVFGSAARSARLRFVLATHPGYSSAAFHTELLSYLNAFQTVDLFAVTAYMSTWPSGPTVDSSFVQYNAGQIHDLVKTATGPLVERLKIISDAAKALGVPTCVFEGGPGLVEDGVIGGGTATGDVTEGLIAANRHPGIGGVLEAVFDALEASGTGLVGNATQPFMYFSGPFGTYSKYGSWGQMEFTDQPIEEAHKYRAVAQRISAHTEAAGAASALEGCVTDAMLRSAAPLHDLFNSTGGWVQRFSGAPAVTSPRLGDELVAGQRYSVMWLADPRRTNTSEQVTVELWQHHDCNASGLVKVLSDSMPNVGALSVALNASEAGGDGFFVRIRSLERASVNYSEPFAIVAAADAPPAFALHIERDVDLLSAYHRDCKKEKGWAIVPHFKIDSCVYSSVEGCRSYRTQRQGYGAPSRWNNWGQWQPMTTAADGSPMGVLHGWGKPVTDCTLHVVGVRATMQLEGLTRGFDTTAADAMAKVVSSESKVPTGSIQFVNVRTVSGFATYYVSDCRRVSCPGGRRLQTTSAAAVGATALEFEVSITSNDDGVRDVLTLLSDLSGGDAGGASSGLNNATQTQSEHFAARLAGELSVAYGETVSVAVRAANVSTAEIAMDDTSGFIIPSASPPPASPRAWLPPPRTPQASPPPPNAYPPTPPGAVVKMQPQVVVTLVAAGAVDDFDQAKRAGLREAFATAAGVAMADVALSVEAASVRLRFEVDVPSEEQGTSLVITLASKLTSASAASALLSIDVQSTPTLASVVTRIVVAGTPPSAPPPGDGSMVIIAAAGGGALLVLCVGLILCKAKARRSRHAEGRSSPQSRCWSQVSLPTPRKTVPV